MSTVVLYCWCHNDSASVLLYFTLKIERLSGKWKSLVILPVPEHDTPIGCTWYCSLVDLNVHCLVPIKGWFPFWHVPLYSGLTNVTLNTMLRQEIWHCYEEHPSQISTCDQKCPSRTVQIDIKNWFQVCLMEI